MKIAARQKILKINRTFTHHLLSQQAAKYFPGDSAWQAGDSIVLDETIGPIVLTEVQAKEINQKDLADFLARQDKNPFGPEQIPAWAGRLAVISAGQDANSYLNDLADSLVKLGELLQAPELLVLGDWPIPWLIQENDSPPVRAALDFLKVNISDDFCGGFILTGQELPVFIPHLFRLIRGNMSLPEFAMAFTTSDTVLSICQYGVLHFESYNAEEFLKISNFYKDRKFSEINECRDPVIFDQFENRSLML